MPILKHELEIDEGNDFNSSFTKLTSYDGVSEQFEIIFTDLVVNPPWTTYRIKSRALNEDGFYSEYSDFLIVAQGSVPSKPSKPKKNLLLSNGTSITVEWDPITSDTLSIYGYQLFADKGNDDELEMIFDGKDFPGWTQFTLTNVTSLKNYRFKVRAVNFNGFGDFSDIALLNTCTNPGFISPPTIVKISTAEVHVNWTKPINDGGCIIKGYNLEIDNNDGVFVPVDTDLETIAFVDNYVINTASKLAGKVYKIRITAIN